jgi:hypothetical protein
MLIIEQPEKMLRDPRNSKGSIELSVMSMCIPVSGDNNILNLLFLIYMSECLDKVQDTAITASMFSNLTSIAEAYHTAA